jgi:hypothetical protein
MKNNRNRTFRRLRKPKTKYTRKMSGGWNFFGNSGKPLTREQMNGTVEEVENLLNDPNQKIDVNAKVVDSNETPLTFAIKMIKSNNDYINRNRSYINGNEQNIINNYYEIVKILLSRPEVDVNKVNYFNETPLYKALMNNDIAMVSLLLSHNKINVNFPVKSLTPLTCAIFYGFGGIAYLLRLHPNIDLLPVKKYFEKPNISFSGITYLYELFNLSTEEVLTLKEKYLTPEQFQYMPTQQQDLTQQGTSSENVYAQPVSGGKRKKHRQTKKHRKSKRAITRRR